MGVKFGIKNCCFVVKPQYGCMIICLIELLWYLTTAYLCLAVLFSSQHNHIMRLDYYRNNTTNMDEIYENGMGILAAVGCILGTFFLFIVTFDTNFPRQLIFVYCIKNLIVFCYAAFALTKLGLEFRTNREVLVDKKLYASAVVVMEILLPIYFTTMAVFFYRDIVPSDTATSKSEQSKSALKLKIQNALKEDEEKLDGDEKAEELDGDEIAKELDEGEEEPSKEEPVTEEPSTEEILKKN